MELSRDAARQVVELYIQAWTEQDPDLLAKVFTEDATYREGVQRPVIVGIDGIREYWLTKVVGEQARIECHLLDLYVDGITAVAEWEATFDDLPNSARKRIREVAILGFDGDRISALREYWSSEVIEKLSDGAALAALSG